MKRVLVISYSQSGQLHEILHNFLKPFQGIDIEQVHIKPKNEYAFPWSSDIFFDIMPETVLEEPVELAPYELKSSKYDLVILGYQPWFLSPSLPATSLLQDSKFLSILKNTPVVTVIGARNMWLNSQISIVERIQAAGGHMVANVPFIDKTQNLVSVLTILHWMLTGKKERKWGILPYPGVAQQDIDGADTLGEAVANAVQKGAYDGLQEAILSQQKVDLHPSIIFIEKRAKRLFTIWANLIRGKGTEAAKRSRWVRFFKYYLVVALFVVSPIVLTVYNILLRPFSGKKIRKDKQHYLYLGINKAKLSKRLKAEDA